MFRCVSFILLFVASVMLHAEHTATSETSKQTTHTSPSIAKRLLNASAPFVGMPYQTSPLGEGPHAPSAIDMDPLFRTDQFDCTTLVETTMAVAASKNEHEIIPILNHIRYRNGQPHFYSRRHFPGHEWIPELQALGLIKDVTKNVAPLYVKTAYKKLDLQTWHRRKRKILSELPDHRIPIQTAKIPMIPIQIAHTFVEQIPAGSILNLVRVNYRNIPVRISHQGLILEQNGKKIIRHAQDRFVHKVIDEPLKHYLKRVQNHKKWPVAGINLQQVINLDVLTPSPIGEGTPTNHHIH